MQNQAPSLRYRRMAIADRGWLLAAAVLALIVVVPDLDRRMAHLAGELEAGTTPRTLITLRKEDEHAPAL